MKEEEIKAVLLDMDDDVVREALALLLAESGTAPAAPQPPDFINFAQAVMYLKKNYEFAELEFFSTQADLVYVAAGGRRILLGDGMADNAGRQSQAKSSGDDSSWGEDAVRETPPARGRFSHLEL